MFEAPRSRREILESKTYRFLCPNCNIPSETWPNSDSFTCPCGAVIQINRSAYTAEVKIFVREILPPDERGLIRKELLPYPIKGLE